MSQRGESMVFVKKSNVFLLVFFGQNKPEKIFFSYSGYKRMFFRKEKWNFKQSRKIIIFQKDLSTVFVPKE